MTGTAAAVTLFMSSCSSIDKDRTTYLNGTAQFQPAPNDKHAKVWKDSQPAPSIASVTVAPVKFLAPPQGLTDEQKQILSQRLQEDLQKRFATAGQPGGRSHVEIRAAITGADKSNVWVNVLADAVLNFPVSMGGVAVELEAVSMPGGKRIAAGQYIIPGRPWDLFSSLTQTGQAKGGLDKASDEFYTLVTGQEPSKTATQTQMVAQNSTSHGQPGQLNGAH